MLCYALFVGHIWQYGDADAVAPCSRHKTGAPWILTLQCHVVKVSISNWPLVAIFFMTQFFPLSCFNLTI